MFDPPPGFEDLLADAAAVEITGEMVDIEIPHVGVVEARRPMPRAAAALSMATNTKLLPRDQIKHPADISLAERDIADKARLHAVQMRYFTQFVIDHIGLQEYERVCEAMIAGDVVEDAIKRVSRVIATWGTARPYTAVSTLALFTGNNWRGVRQKLTYSGIRDPMKLTSLHALLDITEDIVVDSLYQSGQEREGPPSKGEMAVKHFYDLIYAPDPTDPLDVLDEALPMRVPAGFEDPNDVENDFDAFMSGSR
jgi:hypothetical protein